MLPNVCFIQIHMRKSPFCNLTYHCFRSIHKYNQYFIDKKGMFCGNKKKKKICWKLVDATVFYIDSFWFELWN